MNFIEKSPEIKQHLSDVDKKKLFDELNELRMKSEESLVNHPKHYQGNTFEVIDIIEDFKLNFNLGNAIKYILRAGHKGDRITDLQKAIWYIEREMDNGY